MAKKTEQEVLIDIEKFITELNELVLEYKTFENFNKDRKAQHSLSMLFIAIGELCNKLSNNFGEKYGNEIFISAIGMRNFLSHGYWDVDYHMLWDTAVEDIPKLEKLIIRNLQ